VLESQIEKNFIEKLSSELKYVYREDIHDRETLEANFREKFQALNRVPLTDNEFERLLEETAPGSSRYEKRFGAKPNLLEWSIGHHYFVYEGNELLS